MSRSVRQGRGAARRNAALALVVLTGLCATAAATLYVADVAGRQQEERLDQLVGEATGAVRARMEAYVAILRATRGIFVDGREPTRHAFASYVRALELRRQYPGIQGVGFAKLVPAAELAEHEARVRAEGFPEYRIWPQGPRDAYSSIVYLEPFDWRNQRAFGFDMLQEPARGEAMARARDRGEPAASGRVELVQEAGEERQAGFLLYVPVYRGGPEARTVAERRAALAGWIYAPFRARDLLQGTLGRSTGGLDLEIFDGAGTAPETRLLGSAARPGDAAQSRTRQIEVGGRTWTLAFAAGPGIAQHWERWVAWVVLAVGLLLTGLLFWITRAEATALERAEEATRRAAFLADAGRVLASSLDYAQTLRQVASLAAERAADGCIVFLEEPSAPPLWIVGHRDGEIAAAGSEALAAVGFDRESEFGGAVALRTGAPELRNDLDPATMPFFGRSGALRELALRTGVRHALTVPLFARGEPLGAITLVSARPGARFVDDDVAMAEDLARLAVAAVDTGRLYRRSQQSLRLRDEFLSIASHELKTPLTSLGLQAESLRAQAERAPPEVILRKVEAIRRNVDRLGRLVATLLDLSRITAGRLDLEREPVDLGEVAHEVVQRFDEEARRAGCELRLDVRGRITGRWDRLRLDQVLTNLLSNAVKYGPHAPIDVAVEARGGRAVVTVRDRGIGIEIADQERIFERFERAVSERHYGGFGLGLWIVRRIVDALGGTVSVSSAPGEGATFTVELEHAVDERDRASPPADPPLARA